MSMFSIQFRVYTGTDGAYYLVTLGNEAMDQNGTVKPYMLDSVGALISAVEARGWQRSAPDGSQEVVEIQALIKREWTGSDGKPKAALDLYPPWRGEKGGIYKLVTAYINGPEDVAAFERATGLQYNSLPALNRNAPHQRSQAATLPQERMLPNAVQVTRVKVESETSQQGFAWRFAGWGVKAPGSASASRHDEQRPGTIQTGADGVKERIAFLHTAVKVDQGNGQPYMECTTVDGELLPLYRWSDLANAGYAEGTHWQRDERGVKFVSPCAVALTASFRDNRVMWDIRRVLVPGEAEDLYAQVSLADAPQAQPAANQTDIPF